MTDNDRDEWSAQLFNQMVDAGVTLFSYIPDFGNARIVELAEAHNEAQPVLLTTEEEGVAVCAGADLVDKRGVLMMQSSGVGNCPNFLSLVKGGGFPILMVVSMRGDYGDQNPWQYPLGQAVDSLLEAMGVLLFKVDSQEDLEPAITAALSTSGKGGQSCAIILTQRFIGAKAF